MGTIEVTVGRRVADGSEVRIELAKAPHILVAGMTGSGKSVFVNSVIRQMITEHTDKEIGLLLIDPKRVEFSRYKRVPHLLYKPVYDIEDISMSLEWAVNEMRVRFERMEELNHRDLEAHNAWARSMAGRKPWSRLLIIIDELANLMLQDKGLEKPIVALASMGRAAGMHLLLATQRPSADVVTGLIRANVPTRVCMPVVTGMDSRVILDVGGAELMTQPGDILARLPGGRELHRLRCDFHDDADLDAAVERAVLNG